MAATFKWTDLSLPWQACLEEAWLARSAGSRAIGAVITGPEGSILARGRNRIFDPQAPEGLIANSRLAHAEINAMLALPAGVKRSQCILYTSMEPCPLCAGGIYMFGIRTIHYAVRDVYAGSTNLFGATPYLSVKQVQAYFLNQPELEIILTALETEDEIRITPTDYHKVLDVWELNCPQGVALGHQLHKSQEVSGWVKAQWSAQQVFDTLLERVSQ
jgi:tRNA(Arg) A34 adenosine deaminase TadA